VALTPLQRTIEPDALRYQHVSVQIDRSKRTATFTVKALPAQPTDIAGIEAAGAAWYPLQMARELEDAILSMRTNELDIGTWLIKTEGDGRGAGHGRHAATPHRPLAGARDHGLLRRTFSRLDVSSRSLFALIEPGSCFAGTLLELALACDRSYQLVLPDDEPARRSITVGEPTSAATRWSPARAGCSAASTTNSRPWMPCAPRPGQPLDADAAPSRWAW
jgi:benzoyl-CoA-dihydrodiol lyase